MLKIFSNFALRYLKWGLWSSVMVLLFRLRLTNFCYCVVFRCRLTRALFLNEYNADNLGDGVLGIYLI